MPEPRAAASTPPPAILGTGLVALDVILSDDASLPPVLAAGGTCGNVLSALSYLGWDAYPIARLNRDPASQIVLHDLTRWGVSLRFAEQQPPAPTPVFVQTIRRDRHGRTAHKFSTNCPICGAWLPSFRPVTAVAAHGVLEAIAASADLVPRVFFFDRASRSSILLAQALAARGTLVVFEPAGIGEPRLFAEALSAAHVLKYSSERLPELADTGTRPGQLLVEIETSGSAGLRYRARGRRTWAWRRLPAVPAAYVVDTAGAGDWCTAGFLFRLASAGLAGVERATTADLDAALRFGQAAAAIACGYVGARGAMGVLSSGEFLQTAETLLSGSSSMPPGHEGKRRIPQVPSMLGGAYTCPACPT